MVKKLILYLFMNLWCWSAMGQDNRDLETVVTQLDLVAAQMPVTNSSAVSIAIQAGQLNTLNILQIVGNSQLGLSALVIQEGTNNSANLIQQGNNIHARLLQIGSHNQYDVTAIGANIFSKVVQEGYGNHVQTLTTGQRDVNVMRQPYEIRQAGNNNALQLNHGTDIKPYSIEQRGNNMNMTVETLKSVFQ